MAIRIDGTPVGVEAFPRATPRIAVFLHGLMETEFSWGRAPNYGSRLAEDVRLDARVRPLQHRPPDLGERALARRPARGGGRRLARRGRGDRADRPLDGRPRGAQRRAPGRRGGSRVGAAVSHVVSLGTPHRGAPLEEIVHLGSAALALVPETGGMSRFLRRRSGGIRDLRRGSLVDEDWKDRDPDALRAVACKEIPLLEGAKHCFVSCSGDLLVLGSSAAPWRERGVLPRGRRRPLRPAEPPARCTTACATGWPRGLTPLGRRRPSA